MAKFLKSSNIYETFTPLYFIMKPSGLAPYKLDVNARKFVWDLCSFIYFILLFFLFIINVILMGVNYSTEEYNSVVYVGWNMLYLLIVISVAILVAFNAFKCKSTEKILQSLDDFDILVRFI